MPREFEIVLFGATGFAGRLTAEYLARHAPRELRWALAGRSTRRLEEVRAALAQADPDLDTLPLLTADVTDRAAVEQVVRAARVVATTVGPYVLHGEAIVAACADAGTDYLDLTGEPEFVNTTYVRHHRRALETGARLVHSAGFDSVPHDLGAYFTVLQLPEDVPLRVSGYVRASAAFSGGTFQSALTGFSRARQNAAAARERRAQEPHPSQRRARAVPGCPHRDPVDGGWAVPLPTLDGSVVARSARADPRYGPDFRYSHYASAAHLTSVIGGAAAVAALVGAAQVRPLRQALAGRLAPGQGPSASRRARSWFRVTFVGTGGGRRVVTRVSGGDPGYDETAKMLAESALCLALDEVPHVAGQVTTATAMGDALLARLQRAGLSFEVLEAG